MSNHGKFISRYAPVRVSTNRNSIAMVRVLLPGSCLHEPQKCHPVALCPGSCLHEPEFCCHGSCPPPWFVSSRTTKMSPCLVRVYETEGSKVVLNEFN